MPVHRAETFLLRRFSRETFDNLDAEKRLFQLRVDVCAVLLDFGAGFADARADGGDEISERREEEECKNRHPKTLEEHHAHKNDDEGAGAEDVRHRGDGVLPHPHIFGDARHQIAAAFIAECL